MLLIVRNNFIEINTFHCYWPSKMHNTHIRGLFIFIFTALLIFLCNSFIFYFLSTHTSKTLSPPLTIIWILDIPLPPPFSLAKSKNDPLINLKLIINFFFFFLIGKKTCIKRRLLHQENEAARKKKMYKRKRGKQQLCTGRLFD